MGWDWKEKTNIKITNYKVAKAKKKGYKTVSFTYTETETFKPTLKEVKKHNHALNSNPNLEIEGVTNYFIMDFNSGCIAENKEEVTITTQGLKLSGYKQFGNDKVGYLGYYKSWCVPIKITFPEDYEGLCFLVGADNTLSTSKHSANCDSVWEHSFGKSSYYKKNNENCCWMLIQ